MYLIVKTPQKDNIEPEIKEEKKARYEITQVDLFTIKDFHSSELSVMGVMLGDSFDDVLNTLGIPDIQQDFPPNIRNIEYSKRIDLNDTGLILQFTDRILTKITIREPFNKYLIGETQINHSKAEIYKIFGIPDDMQFIPIKAGSFIVFRNNIYKDYGLEIYIRANEQFGFGLVS